MGFFDFLKPTDINAGVKEALATPGAILLDVRTPAEYAAGHIPKSRNLPLDCIGDMAKDYPDQSCAYFLYCQSGMRSQQAAAALRNMGYEHITNIGGIAAYRGRLEE